jgi:hypothetical protein
MLHRVHRSYRAPNLFREACFAIDRCRVHRILAQELRPNCVSLFSRDLQGTTTKDGRGMAWRRMAPPLAQIQQQQGGRSWQPAHQGFRVFGVTGDGSCMFRAIVQGAQIVGRGAYVNRAGIEEACSHTLVMLINFLIFRG